MSTTEALVDRILAREGGYRDLPGDSGGATNYGITAARWGAYQRLNRPATAEEIQAITETQAREFWTGVFAQSIFHGVTYEPLFEQLVDFGANSGDARAVRWLQRVLRIPITGQMDDRTFTALTTYPQFLVHQALIGARVQMIVGAVKDGKIARRDKDGLVKRAVSFSEIRL